MRVHAVALKFDFRDPTKCGRGGPALGGVCLGKHNDSSQTPTNASIGADDVDAVQKALRSSMRLEILHRTTSADFSDASVSSREVKNSERFWCNSCTVAVQRVDGHGHVSSTGGSCRSGRS
jgi:hypothetical protein